MTKNRKQNRISIIKTDNEWVDPQLYKNVLSQTDFIQDVKHPHRSLLLEKISAHTPFNRLLEIGCGYGPNLYLIAKKYPEAELIGLDINPTAVEIGNEFFQKQGLNNVHLIAGRLQDLSRFQERYFDIVLTDAVLIYITPSDIKSVIQEMMRVGNTLIINEWQCFNNFKTRCIDMYYCLKLKYESMKFSNKNISLLHCLFSSKTTSDGLYLGHWARDYKSLFSQFVPSKNIKITKLQNQHWNDANWQKWGAIVEVKIR
jgi:ubiquinone/menaquinone biosynthesis C-methylase UbiE